MLTSTEELRRAEAKRNDNNNCNFEDSESMTWSVNPHCTEDDTVFTHMSNHSQKNDGLARGRRINSAPQPALTDTGNEKRKGKRPRNISDDAAETAPAKTAKTSIPPRGHLPAAFKNPASVAKRNARERRRIKNVNLAFDELREHVPSGEQNKKKISKVDTLQSAIIYIKTLERLVMQRRKQEKKEETQNLESGLDSENATTSTEISVISDNINVCDETTSSINNDSSSVLDDLDDAASTYLPTSQQTDDIVTNVDFDDSGYSDGSPGSHYEKGVHIHQAYESLPFHQSDTDSSLREVTAYDIEKFLDNSMPATENQSTFQQISPPICMSTASFEYPSSLPVVNGWQEYPDTSMMSGHRQFNHLPLASTPRNANEVAAFVFPSPNSNAQVTTSQQHNNIANVSAIRQNIYETATTFEGYRFGGTYA
ncbi:uncharacterized protein LOC120330982 [Styela clava]